MRTDWDDEELRGPRRWWAVVRRRWEEQLQTNGLLRHLVHEPSFLVALLGLVICGVGVLVMIPKVWNPAPPGFSRVVRVSLLDYVQAWNLRRTALKAAAEGRWDEALVAWRAALANNQADIMTHRGALGMLQEAPWVHSANLPLVLFCGESLIELSGTNRVDTTLVAEVLVRHRLPDVAMEVLRGWEAEFRPEEESVWLRALLMTGRLAPFETRWAASGGRWEEDARMRLYRAAVDALGSPDRAVDGLERLRAGVADTDAVRRLEAARLLCWAALRRDDLGEYEKGLKVLRELDSTMVQDEAGWWGLLARHDRVEAARTAAREYPAVPPPTPMEAIQLVRAWSELGLGDLGVAMFRDHAERYGVVLDVWAAYFDLLMERREWDEVRKVAATLRGNASARDDVLAVAWYGEAMADLAQGRRTSAKLNLQRLTEAPVSSPSVVLRLATGLNQVGERETARVLLERIEALMGTQSEYWLQVLINAQGRRDVEALQRATDRLLEVNPGGLIGLNMKLGLMLLKRESPAEALTLSVRLTSGGQVTSGALINHAAALLQNARASEAGAVLARLDPSRLSSVERAAWQLARMEFLGKTGRPDEAVVLGEQIDVNELMPPDAAWRETFLEECRGRVADARP